MEGGEGGGERRGMVKVPGMNESVCVLARVGNVEGGVEVGTEGDRGEQGMQGKGR